MDTNHHEASQVFLYNVNRIWTFLKDQAKVTSFLTKTPNIMSHISNQSILFKDTSGNPKITLTCKEKVTNSFYKQISYILQCGNSHNDKLLKFILYPNTLDNSTLLIFEEYYINEPTDNQCDISNGSLNSNGSSNSNNINDNEHFAHTFLNEFNNFLKETPIYLNEYQSILINTPLKNILKLLSNPRALRSVSNSSPKDFSVFSPCVGDKFNYFNHENIQKYAMIRQYEKEAGRNQWFISVEIFNEDYTETYYMISFKLLLINETCTFLSFHHDFHSSIEQAQVDLIACAKKEFLIDFKKFCEETLPKDDQSPKN